MAGVVLEGVSRVYAGGVVAVDQMNLEVRDGEFLVLLGPSGSGKTTTLRLIAGLETPSAGQIHIAGRVVNQVRPRDRNIAMVFQNHALYPHLTVYRNMAFGLDLRRGGWLRQAWSRIRGPRRNSSPGPAVPRAVDRGAIRARVDAAARDLGIEHLLSRLPGELSGGERQRVALGRALVRQPAVFLLDEPLSNLDAPLRAEIRRDLKLLHQRLGATMIYVTHDQVEALTLGDRVAVLNRGVIEQVATPWEIYDRPANRFVAGFVGSPPMNFFEGTLVPAGAGPQEGAAAAGPGRWRFSGAGWSFAVDISQGTPAEPTAQPISIVLGIRPEDVRIESAASGEEGQAGRVVLVEPMGDSAVVHVEPAGAGAAIDRPAGAGLVRCKIGSRCDVRPGQSVFVDFDGRRAYGFDPVSGRSLPKNQTSLPR
ncbi:MAG: ABC transporter ATP-binding protein [Pirellulales bacterium]